MALQRGAGSELLDQLGLRPRCHPAQHHIDPVWNFREIAAILASCDLLVSTDSAITHLAGAHGLPAILLLKPVPDWRWGLSGEQCSWYPRHRLFRQHPKEPWDQTISRLLSSGWLHSPATTRR